jgi:hypothetical protein
VLDAGTSAAGTAPIKLTSGTNLTVEEAGAIEFDGVNVFVTRAAAREVIPFIGLNLAMRNFILR